MQVTIKGKHVDVGEALRNHIEIHLGDMVEKYFASPIEAQVIISREGHLFCADINVHVSRGITVQGHGTAAEPYPACDSAIDIIAKRLRRHKQRLRNHKALAAAKEEFTSAPVYILAGDIADESEIETNPNDNPIIIAELSTDIARLSVSDAVMRLDLSGQTALLFHHAGHGGLNLVYRRSDGHIGWIDPHGNQAAPHPGPNGTSANRDPTHH